MRKKTLNISLKNHIEKLLGNLLEVENITEIAINRFNEVLYENENGWSKGTPEQNERITKSNCESFSNALASEANQQFNSSNPILGTTLPTDERIQIVIPPAVDSSQYSITIRKPSKFSLELQNFKDAGFFDEVTESDSISGLDLDLMNDINQNNYMEFCQKAVASGKKNLVIAGATGSGKTTFMKALINEIPTNERLITIEDVRELFLTKHPNHVNLLYPSEQKEDTKIRPDTAVKSCLRMKPDRIILAELRGGEAFDYINAISSGHGGSITSLHAGSIEQAIRRLTLMVLQNKTGSQLPYETAQSIIVDTIDVFITIGKINGKRVITSLYWRDYEKNKSLLKLKNAKVKAVA